MKVKGIGGYNGGDGLFFVSPGFYVRVRVRLGLRVQGSGFRVKI